MHLHSITELNELYNDGESADQDVFAEQRSNIQLIAGEHYTKKGSRFWNRLRDNKEINQDQKIRLTKNHIRKIVHKYVNSITSYAPGVQAGPKDKTDLQHQKSSELVNAVWQDAKNRHNLNQKINQWAKDYVGIGEVAVKIFFDPNAGRFIGMEAEVDEEGQPVLDENGQLVPSEVAKFSGDVVIERLFGFNIIRPAGIKDIKTAPWLCHRKMVQIKELKALISSSPNLDEEEKQKIIQKISETPDQTYVVLDGATSSYKQVKNQTMLKEFFFRPCPEYPNGYFYICTETEKIFEGELPFGIYPIVFEGFDEIQTSPRYRSVVKQLRPNQIEINRCASTIAEHQITMGWDKVLTQNGTKVTQGVSFPGVRTFNYSGMAPIIMEGRTGNQYLEYMQAQITEMYSIALVEEQDLEKNVQYDVYSMLSRSIKDKKKFSLYTDGFESFLKEVFKTYINLCQKYYTPEHLIPAIGKSEYVNIDEFKQVKDLCYQIEIDAQTDDSETKLGKQLMLNHLIQYVGPQLAKDDLGKVIRLMPYANDELILEDLTMNYDVATNYILALDRGQVPPPHQYDDHVYMIKKLVARTRKPDFMFLNPKVKQNYINAIKMHENLEVQREIQIKQAQSEFIPVGGFMVACDFYVPNPEDPTKLPKRVRLPSESLNWLVKQLETQGSSQQQLESVNGGALAEMSSMLTNQIGQQNQLAPTNAQTSAGGMYGY